MFSFIIPAHNEELYIDGCIGSINQSLLSFDAPYEIIVVDDGSDDLTLNRAVENGVKVLSVDKRNIAAARNHGAMDAKFDILIFIDADTRISCELIDQILLSIEAGYEFGGPERIKLFDYKISISSLLRVLLYNFLQRNHMFVGCCLFVKKKSLYEVGGFNEKRLYGEDVAFSCACRNRLKTKCLNCQIYTSGRKSYAYSLWREFVQLVKLLGLQGVPGKDRILLDHWYKRKS